MRLHLSVFILFFTIMQVNAETFAQMVTLKERNVSLTSVFESIKEQTGYVFVYNSNELKNSNINIKVHNATIEKALEASLRDLPFTFKIVENNILIRKDETKLIANTLTAEIQQKEIRGNVVDQDGDPLFGVSVRLKGTSIGTTTDNLGNYLISIPNDQGVLVFTYVGFAQQEISIGTNNLINVTLLEEESSLSEVVVVGYGTQRKTDITGSVASLPRERLDMVPNLNVAQALQGAIPGVLVQTSSGGASSSESMMIRGRNSIAASNSPLIVLDGIPYGGSLRDININDVQSIEVLKDASAAAIYGSRASSGVILVTTKDGVEGKPRISYDGKYSIQSFSNLPDLMNGAEFYEFKNIRFPGIMTQSEKDVYDNKEWTNWMDLAFRKGSSHQHNLSVSGGSQNTKFFLAGGFLDVKGLAINDNYRRLTSRINVDTKIDKWLTVGTRTQMNYDNRNGEAPSMSEVFAMTPLVKAFDEYGNQLIQPWPEDTGFGNPLQPILFENTNLSYQILTNNFALIDFPFIPGLAYKLNTGIRIRATDVATYRGRDTKEGLDVRGSSATERELFNNTVIENILTYNKEIREHSIFATALYSFEKNKSSTDGLNASRFPHDFLTYYSAAQAELVEPLYSFNETELVSQMLRLNYAYQSRYLVTLTGRRDGFSGFGAETKWGIFPSAAIGWNIDKEDFFPWKGVFNELKLRASLGRNGKQASGAYSSISRLSEFNIVDRKVSFPGYIPSRLGQENLSWESSETLNLGLDFGILQNRFTGDINVYKTNTTDLLLNRSISAVHGINSIVQNIGETQNKGIELSVNSNNLTNGNFKWATTGNMAFVKNEIVSLGQFDASGKPIDDVANSWFIGKPINVNYDYVWVGTWQQDEAEEAAKWNTKPGFVKLKDKDGDYQLTGIDREIIGQQDPKFIWGLTNSFSYKSVKLNIFIHGVHGITKSNPYMSDYVYAEVRRNTVKKNWWTPTNPTNEWIINDLNADRMNGIIAGYYQSANFVRIKDITLSYDLPTELISRIGIDQLRLYAVGRNQFTFTKWTGLDPELSGQRAIPLQKEIVFGLALNF